MANEPTTSYFKADDVRSPPLSKKAASELAIKKLEQAKADRITKAMKSANSKVGMFKSF